MRSTPARALRQGQLIVDRYSVSKITAEPYRLPHNTVSVELTNQLTSEQSTRNLRWDEHVTTEEPLEVKIGETGTIMVELASPADEEGRPTYKYKITDEAAGIDHEGVDLHLGARLPADNTKAAKTLLSFLMAAGEAKQSEMQGRESENADLFPPEISDWAYVNQEELLGAHLVLTHKSLGFDQ